MSAPTESNRNAHRYQLTPGDLSYAESAVTACAQAVSLATEAAERLEQAAARARDARQLGWAADIDSAREQMLAAAGSVSERTRMASGALKLRSAKR